MSAVTSDARWRDVLLVHRLEFPFPVLYACYAVWGACYATGEATALVRWPVVAAVVANLLLVVAGLALNTAVDVPTDQRHTQRRRHAESALRLGQNRILRWAAVEMVLAWLLALLVTVWSGHWMSVAAATAIITLNVLYNVEPMRLKRRGFVGVIAYCLGVVLLPGLLSYAAVRPVPGLSTWLVLGGAGILAVGRMTWWSIPDKAADTATGMITPTVRYGTTRSLAVSCLIMLAGLVVVSVGLGMRFAPLWTLLGVAAHVVFLVGAARRLPILNPRWLPSEARMRRRGMPIAMVGEGMLMLVPLVG